MWSRKHYVLFTVIVTVALFMALGVVSMVTGIIFADELRQFNYRNYCFVNGAAQLLLSFAAIAVMKKTGTYIKEEFSAKGLGRGLYIGLVGIGFAVFMFVFNLVGTFQYLIAPNFLELLSCLFIAFTTGLFEEILVRGFVLNNLNFNMDPTGGSTKKALVWSSVIFGVMHFVNISAWTVDNVVSVTFQVMNAIIIGLFFGCVYLRSNNMWSVIIIHALIDAATFVFNAMLSAEAFVSPGTEQGNIIVSAVFSLALMIPYIIAILVMYKKIPNKAKPLQGLVPAEHFSE